ncbi:MAG TPA: phosphate ABC transporter permease subunit PstC [Chitinispirillaceae bacterium]|nr:phosphate ABC transporter permease subunit PstC [Chitinispirillaceae bacterium]
MKSQETLIEKNTKQKVKDTVSGTHGTELIVTGNKHGDISRKKVRPLESALEKGISVTAFLSLAFIILIFVFVFKEASTVFFPHKNVSTEEVGVSETYGEEMLGDIPAPAEEMGNLEADETGSSFFDLFGTAWLPVSLSPKYGILPLLIGSLKVALIAILFSAPLAISAALYTSFFASAKAKEIIKPVIEVLAGFPSVVIGFFSLMVVASLIQNIFGLQYRLNAFTGGIALCIAIIPVVYTIAEDSLNAVPRSYVDASLALGGEYWQTALFVVLPAALPGIFAAVLLGVGRAIGETMIVLMVTGNAAFSSVSPFEPVRTMSATIGAEMAEVVFGDFHYSVLFFVGVVLFLISFGINIFAESVVRQLVMRRFK